LEWVVAVMEEDSVGEVIVVSSNPDIEDPIGGRNPLNTFNNNSWTAAQRLRFRCACA